VTRKHFGTETVLHYFQIFLNEFGTRKNPDSDSESVCAPLGLEHVQTQTQTQTRDVRNFDFDFEIFDIFGVLEF
jgi:hypothetical protein